MLCAMKSLIFGILTIFSDKKVTPKSSLKAVFLLMRHGDRAPTFAYPKDPYNFYRWPGGLGALSQKGENQMLQSGTIKARRYARLLNNPGLNNVLVLSSSSKRCITSAEKFLDGFLHVRRPQNMVNVLPSEEDEFLAVRGKDCSNYIHTLTENCNLNKPVVKEYMTTHGITKEFFEYLETHTGLVIKSLIQIHGLDDVLYVQQENGFPPPQWVKSIYHNILHSLANFAYDLKCSSKYLNIRSGVLIRDIIERIDEYLSSSSKENIAIYSAHDITISGLLHHLELFTQVNFKPEYGSCFALELHENPSISGGFEVKIFYFKNYADEDPMAIRIPNCAAHCSLDKFKEIMQSKITYSYEETCRKGDGNLHSYLKATMFSK